MPAATCRPEVVFRVLPPGFSHAICHSFYCSAVVSISLRRNTPPAMLPLRHFRHISALQRLSFFAFALSMSGERSFQFAESAASAAILPAAADMPPIPAADARRALCHADPQSPRSFDY